MADGQSVQQRVQELEGRVSRLGAALRSTRQQLEAERRAHVAAVESASRAWRLSCARFPTREPRG